LAEHDRVAAQIAPYVAMDTRKAYANDQVALYQEDMWYFMSDRRERIAAWIPAASGAPPTGIIPQR
ncbi:MAG TPA: hypothetical protein VIQ54_18385, partial [Polyangia bacterium]